MSQNTTVVNSRSVICSICSLPVSRRLVSSCDNCEQLFHPLCRSEHVCPSMQSIHLPVDPLLQLSQSSSSVPLHPARPSAVRRSHSATRPSLDPLLPTTSVRRSHSTTHPSLDPPHPTVSAHSLIPPLHVAVAPYRPSSVRANVLHFCASQSPPLPADSTATNSETQPVTLPSLEDCVLLATHFPVRVYLRLPFLEAREWIRVVTLCATLATMRYLIPFLPMLLLYRKRGGSRQRRILLNRLRECVDETSLARIIFRSFTVISSPDAFHCTPRSCDSVGLSDIQRAVFGGSLARARRLLSPTRRIHITPEICTQLRNMFPSDPGPPFSFSSLSTPIGFTVASVSKALSAFKAGKASGFSGWKKEFLSPIFRYGCSSTVQHVVNLIADIASPASPIAAALSSDRLIPIPKAESQGVRPIVLTEFLVKLAWKTQLIAAGPKLRALVGDHQFIGQTDAIHSVRNSLFEALATGHVVVKLDVANAFNSTYRHAFLSRLTHLTGLHGLIHNFYLTPRKVVIPNVIEIIPMRGSNQGSSEAPIFFSVAIGDLSVEGRLLAIADDLYCITSPHSCFSAFASISSQLSSKGLSLSQAKCCIIAPSSLHAQITSARPGNLNFLRIVHEVPSVLGAPLYTTPPLTAPMQLISIFREMHALSSAPLDCQSRWVIWHYSIRASLKFILRVMPRSDMAPFNKLLLDAQMTFLIHILRHSSLWSDEFLANPRLEHNATLPLLCGGLGLLSAVERHPIPSRARQLNLSIDLSIFPYGYSELPYHSISSYSADHLCFTLLPFDDLYKIDSDSFSTALLFRLNLIVLRANPRCRSDVLPPMTDPAIDAHHRIDHVIHCSSCAGYDLTLRHEALLQTLRSVASRYSIACHLTTQHGTQSQKDVPVPDGYIALPDGTTIHFDFAIVHQPLWRSINQFEANYSRKSARYRKLDLHVSFIVFSTHGIPTAATYALLQLIARRASLVGFVRSTINAIQATLARFQSTLLARYSTRLTSSLADDACDLSSDSSSPPS